MRKIIGVTVGTPLSANTIKEKLKPVLSVNGVRPDESGNVDNIFDFEELTEEQKASLKGEKGDAFTYEDFTEEQLASLKGENGKDGYTPVKGKDYFDGNDGKDGHTPVKGVDYFDGVDGKTAYQYAQEGGFSGSESEFAAKIAKEIPTKVSQLANDEGYLKSYTESDPTVPEWAKQQTKPKYTADEVGARPSTWMPTADEVGARPEEWMPTAEQVGAHPSNWMPSAEDVGARPSTWMPTYSDVGADKSGTADTKVATHNTNGDAHNDIRLLIEGLTTRLNALANSDDTTLDQMKEVVDYIKANRDLIEEITTNKISYSDIVNNLTTNVSGKPLSAAQGVALKALIDAITIPTKVSELTNDAGYLKSYTESDPTVPSWAKASTKPKYTAEEVGAVSSNALADAINVALATAKESGEFDGKDGRDGEDGYTPVKGVDYYTPAEKNEFSEYIVSELAKRGQVKPEFADSIDECTDTSKMYVLPDGYIYAYKTTETFKDNDNKILSSIGSDGNPYNGGVGYKTGYRLNSSAAEAAKAGTVVSGFIRYTTGKDIEIRVPRTSLSSYDYLHCYNSAFAWIPKNAAGDRVDGSEKQLSNWVSKYGATQVIEDATIKVHIPAASLAIDGIYYVRVSSEPTTTVNSTTFDLAIGESVDGSIVTGNAWTNTGHAFVPADYGDRIVDLENESADHEIRLKLIEANENDDGVPTYWLEELEAKSDAIQQAVETAGSNKSAFLWYTDAHWQSNSKMSPALLNYLVKNTPINKVNFGGDIVGDPSAFTHDNEKYVYAWRKLIADLPNHHSVYGNHDVNHRSTDVGKLAYSLLLSSEESSDMIVGGDSCYYIDNQSEKTRYLYLSYLTNNHDEMVAQGQFIVNALLGVNEGWHIVAIAHRWFQYTSSSAPTVGSVPSYEKEILKIFDEYNARTSHTASNYFASQSFASGKGKVEFCIGGHIHVDYDFNTDGGIPVIITASDTNQERASGETEDSGTVGTTTESAVYGIVADYNNNKIKVIGVGRGGSREVSY